MPTSGADTGVVRMVRMTDEERAGWDEYKRGVINKDRDKIAKLEKRVAFLEARLVDVALLGKSL